MDHTRSVLGRTSIMVAAMWSLSAVSQAAPVDTIFSAENSLYGRGYDIGRADGWMDDALHRAISRFQSRTKGLSASGNLDPATLKALSVDASGGTISGNALASKRAAMATLELTVSSGGSAPGTTGETTAPAVAKTEPEPAPTPEPAPAKAETVAPEPEPVVVADIPEPQAKSEPEPKRAIEPDPKARAVPTMSEPDVAVLKKQPEPENAKTVTTTQSSDEKAVRAGSGPSHTATTVVQETAPVEPAVKTTVAAEDNQTREAPQKPAAPADTVDTNSQDNGIKTVAAADEAPAKPAPETTEAGKQRTGQKATGSSGGFFSWLFDLLFGWMA